jgi:hypothetical protein
MLPIPGTTSVAHLEGNVGSADLKLSAEDFARLGLINSTFPPHRPCAQRARAGCRKRHLIAACHQRRHARHGSPCTARRIRCHTEQHALVEPVTRAVYPQQERLPAHLRRTRGQEGPPPWWTTRRSGVVEGRPRPPQSLPCRRETNQGSEAANLGPAGNPVTRALHLDRIERTCAL